MLNSVVELSRFIKVFLLFEPSKQAVIGVLRGGFRYLRPVIVNFLSPHKLNHGGHSAQAFSSLFLQMAGRIRRLYHVMQPVAPSLIIFQSNFPLSFTHPEFGWDIDL